MYIYILQPKQYVGTTIYKIGMSSLGDLSRMKSYGKGTRYIGMAEVGRDYLAVERKLIRLFNEHFTLARGREYFEVDDEVTARRLFLSTTMDVLETPNPPTTSMGTTETIPHSSDHGLFSRYSFNAHSTRVAPSSDDRYVQPKKNAIRSEQPPSLSNGNPWMKFTYYG
jgi:hypothetical protein